MRDLVLTAVVFGLIPVILARPWTGILVWSWLGYMNPHRLTWGFAYSMPFAQIIALVIFVSLFFSKEKKKLIWSREITVLALFIVWCIITTQFALNPDYASLQLEKVLKIQLMTFMTLVLIDRKERIEPLIWVIVFSLGFYGVKGGIFTITSGGGFHVMGPLGTFIGGNNEIGLAMLMTLPLMRYIQLQTKQRWVKLLMAACLGFTFIAILGTQSRGALVGAIVTGAFLIWNSPRKFTFLLLIALAVPPAFKFMPDTWWDRMDTIQTYEEDASAQGRISAWTFATKVARARVTGGGFECFQGRIFRQYHNGPVHDAHSIWFEILGEHGFIGLGLFFSLG
ncbi:MAG: putative O-glycosylation ligase, exosortase A system-associated, partial [Planctomycetaceae bacterium]|nr:putative O-glycosylation ligase, exosortase A system-associated [Planctomycetaceae bacterium]